VTNVWRRCVCSASIVAGVVILGQGAAASPVAAVVTITRAGVAPTTLTVQAGLKIPVWYNADGAAHTIAFDGRSCAIVVAPAANAFCEDAFWQRVGTYTYHVTGVDQPATVDVVPAPRSITMHASRTTIRSGQALTLTGTFSYATASPPRGRGQIVSVRRRFASGGAFKRFRVAVPHLPVSGHEYTWRLKLRPTRTASYLAVADEQPADGRIWRDARTRVVTVRVRR
jgi:hypothetical protein